MFSKSSVVGATVFFAAVAQAHMIMNHPVPYGKSSLTNSPLASDGSDFPCKLRDGVYDWPAEDEMNYFETGVSQALNFTGMAVHGGGSCQISLTTDMEPTKSTVWQVIKSFEGGCPANVDGNLDGDASTPDPYQFNFTIPTDFSAGNYTLAWTWFNRVGGREMYMNCAPITVTEGSSQKRAVAKRSSYPDLFVANINGCITPEGVDIRFPNPGDVVEYDGEASRLAAPDAAACTGVSTVWGGGSSTTAAASASSTTTTALTGTIIATAPAMAIETSAATSSAESRTRTTTAAPAATSTDTTGARPNEHQQNAVHTTSTATTTASDSTSTSATLSGVLTGACSPEGSWWCNAGVSFQRCANGVWTPAQDMAPGTVCMAGQSSDLTISLAKKRREEQRMRRRHLA
ncbi:uncharacterized protein BO97DRAFT_453251 [Aspergillus homomorphus CBS 101889]|uniref:Lytic polysaccharide monooxygenase n=1 Tax=Aspergillus homomorphus (strain CBS 101889) TaxID=1450537 RepID=A0A395HWF9_ASPHC|nr:hypothetical protein BO97DRAFT_453251 [Aspergillus homomorphus CBS 101889]RAL11763.1 hypothetical protein BO97DRAFT_453251 [Aspergillus homomorphus CBS 101889]